MCGIAGIILQRGQPGSIDAGAITRRMADALISCGPDDAGVWVEKHAGKLTLGHGRLAFSDLSSAGHQPLMSASGWYVIALHGRLVK
jgi:asparagine synthase (glutamine-hydrolysing)